MKKTLFTLALIAITSSASFAQGIIALGNSALTRIQIRDGATPRNVTSADGVKISVFFGPAGASADALQPVLGTDGIAVGTTAGVLVGTGLGAFALPGTEGGQTVSLQIRATASNGMYGETKVAQVTLTSAPSSGAVIWQTASGTVASRFTPLVIVPEPSTIALGVLGLGSLLLFRRRK